MNKITILLDGAEVSTIPFIDKADAVEMVIRLIDVASGNLATVEMDDFPEEELSSIWLGDD